VLGGDGAGSNPFWGFEMIRAAMANSKPGPPLTLWLFGLVFLVPGILLGAAFLVVFGAVVLLLAALWLASELRHGHRAARLERRAREEDAGRG